MLYEYFLFTLLKTLQPEINFFCFMDDDISAIAQPSGAMAPKFCKDTFDQPMIKNLRVGGRDGEDILNKI